MLVYHILSLDKLVSGIILFVLLILIVNSKLEVLVFLYNCRVQVSFETGFKAFCRGLVTLDLVNYFILKVSNILVHMYVYIYLYLYVYIYISIYFFYFTFTHTHTHLLPPTRMCWKSELEVPTSNWSHGSEKKGQGSEEFMDLTNLVDDSWGNFLKRYTEWYF